MLENAVRMVDMANYPSIRIYLSARSNLSNTISHYLNLFQEPRDRKKPLMDCIRWYCGRRESLARKLAKAYECRRWLAKADLR